MSSKKIQDNGKKMIDLMRRLYPICRSITGEGIRETLRIISEEIPLKINYVLTGTNVFDWTIPKEWNIKDAWIKDPSGKKIVDFKKSNLHVLNYSIPIHKKLSLEKLKDNLHSLPNHPDWIPYLTSYYKENWGFCLSHNQFVTMKDGLYEVFIDSDISDGNVTYGEYYIPGQTENEVLLSCYVCHPSLCNDNLSGPVLLTFLADILRKTKTKNSYRFLFIPETIGAVAWLKVNEDNLNKIKAGLVATCLGDNGHMMYQKTRQGDTLIDRAVAKVLEESGQKYEIFDYDPTGSDERQFSSPGFNLPMGSLTRTMYGKFPEYHTSADNLKFMNRKSLVDSLSKYLDVVFILENEGVYLNQNPKCEPQLGKRGLYRTIGSRKNMGAIQSALLWVLNQSDGSKSLLDISIRSKINFRDIKTAADLLTDKQLLKKIKKATKAPRIRASFNNKESL